MRPHCFRVTCISVKSPEFHILITRLWHVYVCSIFEHVCVDAGKKTRVPKGPCYSILSYSIEIVSH